MSHAIRTADLLYSMQEGCRLLPSAAADIITTTAIKPAERDGKIQALNHVKSLLVGRRALNRTKDYLAAVDELLIFVEASIERVTEGGEVYSEASCQE